MKEVHGVLDPEGDGQPYEKIVGKILHLFIIYKEVEQNYNPG